MRHKQFLSACRDARFYAEIRIMRSDLDRIRHESNTQREKVCLFSSLYACYALHHNVRLTHDVCSPICCRYLVQQIKDNTEKIKLNKQLPWLVGNVIEVLTLTDEPEDEEDGGAMDTDAARGQSFLSL